MCADPAPALDMDAVHTFAFKVLGDVTAAQMGTLSALADRLGLFGHLADGDPTTTSAEFAARAGIDERFGEHDHPLGIGAFGYSASTSYCMTQALAVGGEGTGTYMGEEKAYALATEAGFTRLRRIDFPNNPFNPFYEIWA